MNKYLLRIVSLVLILCLIADPVTAAVFSGFLPRDKRLLNRTYFNEFEVQAIIDPVIFERSSILSPDVPAEVRRSVKTHAVDERMSLISAKSDYTPKTTVTKGPEEPGIIAARRIAELIRTNNALGKKTVLGLPTDGTSVSMYEELKKMNLDWSNVHAFPLDEYIGLKAGHPQSFRKTLGTRFFNHVGIPKENQHFFNGKADDSEAEARRYEEEIQKAGGLDLAILGIGENGHIAFMEPGSVFDSKTQVVTIAERTRAANARFFDGDISKVPTRAFSMGISTILGAKEIILLANTPNKADAINRALNGPITVDVPASALRLHPHHNVHFIISHEAATHLRRDPQSTDLEATLLVELGGTNLHAARMTASGELMAIRHTTHPTKKEGSEPLLEAIVNFIDPMQTKEGPPITFVEFATPGIMRPDGYMILTTKLALTGVHLRNELEERLIKRWGHPVQVNLCTDTRAGGLGEPAGRFIYLNLGTGLSASLVDGDVVTPIELGQQAFEGETLETRYTTLQKESRWEDIAHLVAGPLQQLARTYQVSTIRAGGSTATRTPVTVGTLRSLLTNDLQLHISEVPEEERGLRGLVRLAKLRAAPKPNDLERIREVVRQNPPASFDWASIRVWWSATRDTFRRDIPDLTLMKVANAFYSVSENPFPLLDIQERGPVLDLVLDLHETFEAWLAQVLKRLNPEHFRGRPHGAVIRALEASLLEGHTEPPIPRRDFRIYLEELAATDEGSQIIQSWLTSAPKTRQKRSKSPVHLTPMHPFPPLDPSSLEESEERLPDSLPWQLVQRLYKRIISPHGEVETKITQSAPVLEIAERALRAYRKSLKRMFRDGSRNRILADWTREVIATNPDLQAVASTPDTRRRLLDEALKIPDQIRQRITAEDNGLKVSMIALMILGLSARASMQSLSPIIAQQYDQPGLFPNSDAVGTLMAVISGSLFIICWGMRWFYTHTESGGHPKRDRTKARVYALLMILTASTFLGGIPLMEPQLASDLSISLMHAVIRIMKWAGLVGIAIASQKTHRSA